MIQIDDRVAEQRRYLLTAEPIQLMLIPDAIRKCVVFVGSKKPTGKYDPGGTAFFVSRRVEGEDWAFSYIVTARHVIEAARENEQDTVSLRLNRLNGSPQWVETPGREWIYHENQAVDVAVLRTLSPDGDHDHLCYPVEGFVTGGIVTTAQGSNWSHASTIGVGDDVFITGLYTERPGKQRNIPIVRVGNIAACPEETRLGGDRFLDAYLIEVRSIGGLSGSPVFVHMGVKDEAMGYDERQKVPIRMSDMGLKGRPKFYLMGLIHGHHDMEVMTAKINAGIAIVVPAEKIAEALNHPMVQQQGDKELRDRRKRNLPTLDSIVASKRILTKQDFQKALKAVSKKKRDPASS